MSMGGTSRGTPREKVDPKSGHFPGGSGFWRPPGTPCDKTSKTSTKCRRLRQKVAHFPSMGSCFWTIRRIQGFGWHQVGYEVSPYPYAPSPEVLQFLGGVVPKSGRFFTHGFPDARIFERGFLKSDPLGSTQGPKILRVLPRDPPPSSIFDKGDSPMPTAMW